MREAILDDAICRLIATGQQYLTRFKNLQTYATQLQQADAALKSGACQTCSNTVKHADIYASIRSRVNSMSKQDKRDLLTMLGFEKLSIPLGTQYKDIEIGPAPIPRT